MDDCFDVGVIGLGEAGTAVARRLAEKGVKVIGSKRHAVEIEGIATTTVNTAVVDKSDVLIIAVRQTDLAGVCSELGEHVKGKIVISLVAGVETATLERLLEGAYIFRIMTSLGFEYGEANSSFCCSSNCRLGERWLVRHLLSAGGMVTELEENKMNAHTAAAGCGIGMLADITSSFVEAYKGIGFDDSAALEIAVSNLKSAARLIEKQGDAKSAADKVTSKGGATRRGRDVMESNGVKTGIINGVAAAEARCAELSTLVNGKPGVSIRKA